MPGKWHSGTKTSRWMVEEEPVLSDCSRKKTEKAEHLSGSDRELIEKVSKKIALNFARVFLINKNLRGGL